jgi:hypothetical protein
MAGVLVYKSINLLMSYFFQVAGQEGGVMNAPLDTVRPRIRPSELRPLAPKHTPGITVEPLSFI